MAENLEERLAAETRWLMSLAPEARTQYVKGVIESLGDSFKEMFNVKGKIKLAKTADNFLKELNDKATTLIPPIVYSMKLEFQPIYLRFLEEVSALMEKG